MIGRNIHTNIESRPLTLDSQLTISSDIKDGEAPHAPRPDPGLEIELKLLAAAGDLDRLREAPSIVRYGGKAGVVRRLNATYYDTPDRALSRHGMSLRVRQDGKRFVQTLKRAPFHGQPFARGEWEAPVTGRALDLATLPLAEIGAPLEGLAVDALSEVFTTKVRRRTQRLELPGAVVEVAFDEGSIEAGERRQRLTEIELELKSGDASVLYDLGLQLLEIAPLRISTQSKADRGYFLAFDVPPKALKATPPAVAAEHTVDDVIALLLASCQHHLLSNQIIANSGRDPEGVHQMRVALRRLRTACILIGREIGSPTLQAFASEARWLAQALGGAREWDVLATDTMRRPTQALGSAIDFDSLRKAAEPHRLAAYDVVRETLAGTRYNRFNLSLRRCVECRGWRNEMAGSALAGLLEPAPLLANRLLAQLHRKALKRGAHFRDLSPEARHSLRITLKKLRYGIEFFRGLYGETGKTKAYVGYLAKLQDVLGHANDASMTQPFLSILARDSGAPDVHRAIGALVGWQARDWIEVDETLYKHWRRFKALPVFWSDRAEIDSRT